MQQPDSQAAERESEHWLCRALQHCQRCRAAAPRRMQVPARLTGVRKSGAYGTAYRKVMLCESCKCAAVAAGYELLAPLSAATPPRKRNARGQFR
jgi:hypothetical protein